MAAPDLIIDPGALLRAGRASVDGAETVHGAARDVRIPNVGFSGFAAELRLRDRVRDLAERLRHNGEALAEIAVEARDRDGAVGDAFLDLYARGWR